MTARAKREGIVSLNLIAIIIKAVVRTVASSSSGDYVNSKEYRKPEWVTRMEEIQKRLSGE